MNDLFIKVVSGLLTIFVAIIMYVVIPWIKTKITEEQMRLLEQYTEYAVRCAEQIFTQDEWQEKKIWVTEYVTAIINDKFNLTLTTEDINTLIEGVVHLVKKG